MRWIILLAGVFNVAVFFLDNNAAEADYRVVILTIGLMLIFLGVLQMVPVGWRIPIAILRVAYLVAVVAAAVAVTVHFATGFF